jgi:3'-5' exoribonuclease
VAAAILHDIGKLRELEYHPVETKYTKHGNLIGHILMGRDLVRDTARRIDASRRRRCCCWSTRSWRTTASPSSARRRRR